MLKAIKDWFREPKKAVVEYMQYSEAFKSPKKKNKYIIRFLDMGNDVYIIEYESKAHKGAMTGLGVPEALYILSKCKELMLGILKEKPNASFGIMSWPMNKKDSKKTGKPSRLFNVYGMMAEKYCNSVEGKNIFKIHYFYKKEIIVLLNNNNEINVNTILDIFDLTYHLQ